jgi:hypothetical protein
MKDSPAGTRRAHRAAKLPATAPYMKINIYVTMMNITDNPPMWKTGSALARFVDNYVDIVEN